MFHPRASDLMYDLLELAGDFHLAQVLSSSAGLEGALSIGLKEGWILLGDGREISDWANAARYFDEADQLAARITKKEKALFVLYSQLMLALWMGYMRGYIIFGARKAAKAASEAARGPLKGQPGSPGACGSRSPQARIQGSTSVTSKKEGNMIEVKMTLDRVTKGAVRYMEPGSTAAHKIGGLYLRKDALPQPWPGAITVKIEPEAAAKE